MSETEMPMEQLIALSAQFTQFQVGQGALKKVGAAMSAQEGPVIAAHMMKEFLLDSLAQAANEMPNTDELVSAMSSCKGCEFLESAVSKAYGFLSVIAVTDDSE